jgi:hypothetical protein
LAELKWRKKRVSQASIELRIPSPVEQEMSPKATEGVLATGPTLPFGEER